MIVRKHFEIGETAVTIVAEEELIWYAEQAIFERRAELVKFIERDPFFQLTFEPYDEPESAPEIVKRMCHAARIADVGPMAAVAGTIAGSAVQAMVDQGADHAIVDNGGDIALILREETPIGIYAGQSQFKGLAYLMPRTDGIYGVCTSSGTVGPSISLGAADAATVFAKNVSLADACATRLGNLVKDEREDTLGAAVKLVAGLDGVDGCVAMIGSKMAMRGRVPELVRCGETRSKVSEVQL
ncbi:MAG: hypothetical protein A4E32_01007 [Methanomassiliicoccales archaeon PtaU1.Bin124]|nr:MAG: hypothetical protein A4E32_01007 [Methanomassiliicoccales archaeon PtaU1.Bin124]